MKNKTRIVLLAVVITAFLGFAITSVINSSEYIQESGQITRIENSDMFRMINTGFVYFGRDTCPFCREFKPLLEKAILQENIEVFYFDTDYFRKNNLLTEEELQDIFREFMIFQVPTLIKVREGLVYDVLTADIRLDEYHIVKNSIRYFIDVNSM